MLSRSEVVSLDKTFLWHPYTAMDLYVRDVDPFVIDRAEGPFLFDMDGRRYIDANASWWLSVLGHNHPRLVASLKRQADQMCHCSLAGTTHPQAAQLARDLIEVAPRGLARVFFSDDGSTAVESAVKMALQFFFQNNSPRRTTKTRFVALDGAFHGETVGASSLGGVEVFRRPFASVLFDCIRVPSPADPNGWHRAFDTLMSIIARSADEIAGVVIEPVVQGAAGMQVYDPAYLVELRRVCSRHDVLLIADEVFTGYGRTGHMWGCDHAGICPDILCVGKGFSGGVLPMAATLTTEQVFQGFSGDRSRAFLYGHSYGGNPLAAAVARETLAIFRDERIVEKSRPKAGRIASAFRRIASLPGACNARWCGMIGAVDLAIDTPAQPPVAADAIETEEDLSAKGYLGGAGWLVYEAARRRGAYLRPLGNTVYVCPALNIPDDVLDDLLRIVHDSIEEVVVRKAW